MSSSTQLECPQDQNSKPPPNRRRDKRQLSCNFCRHRKLKCDRRRPCAACTARGLTCSFPSPTSNPSRLSPSQSGPRLTLESLEDRVRSLEGLVLSTITAVRHQQAETGPASSSSEGLSPPGPHVSESGTMHRSAKGTSYVGSPHWAAIIDGISELKDHFDHIDGSQAPSELGQQPVSPSPEPLLLYSCTRPPPREQLISELPERSIVDRMVFQYFSEISILPLCILHPSTFLQQYESFWADPSTASIHWLGLLYSIMCLSVIFFLHSEQQTIGSVFKMRGSPFQPKYLEQMVHCLIGGDYIRGGPNVIETLIHYSLLEAFRQVDSEAGNWMVSGLTTQLAMRMGYHRDPCHFPEISCFEGEIRRRLWAMIHICDTTFSVLSGAPRVIAEGSWDTKPPRNLHNMDLDRNSTHLPDSRPGTELTPMSFSLARYQLSLSMGWLIDASISHGFRSPAERRHAESRLVDTWDTIPVWFKFTSFSECLSESPARVAQRLGITCLYNKMLIMLHRCNLLGSPPAERNPAAGEDADYEVYSRRTCIHAALQNLECLLLLEGEARPGG
ncbi:hypothetical protein BKA56DRAFT_662631, partial [Ilyonectria sp. MPI-CAGE-AT-0026]